MNIPYEVADVADLALEDLARHQAHNVDLNPFSTPGARHEWQLGYEGKEADRHSFSRIWWRGHCARELTARS